MGGVNLLETKNLGNRLIQLINEELENKRFQLDEDKEKKVRAIVHMAFQEGYGDCLKDVREGLIK